MTPRDPVRRAVLADRRRTTAALLKIERRLRARQSFAAAGALIARIELGNAWREADRKARKPKRGHAACYQRGNICATPKSGTRWACAAPKDHSGKHHACMGGEMQVEWGDTRKRRSK